LALLFIFSFFLLFCFEKKEKIEKSKIKIEKNKK